MKTIVLGFSKSSLKFAPFSWLIMWAQGTPYSHAYVKIHSEMLDQEVYFQASHSLVNCMNPTVFLAQETVFEEFTFEVTDANYIALKQFLFQQLGKPYAVGEIFGLALVLALKMIGIKITNPVTDGSAAFFCSGLVALLLKDVEGISLSEPIEDITPADLYPIVKALPKTLA